MVNVDYDTNVQYVRKRHIRYVPTLCVKKGNFLFTFAAIIVLKFIEIVFVVLLAVEEKVEESCSLPFVMAAEEGC